MPVIVHLLRAALVLSNVYETFKTLKPPRSSRHSGRPSVRALSQRKREMKGCLTIWMVWFCITSYEKLIERIVRIFIPFYDELKSLVIIFLILTKARSTEPIFLYFIRPTIKPYIPTLDPILDVVSVGGDLILYPFLYPINVLYSWWNPSYSDETPLDTSSPGASAYITEGDLDTPLEAPESLVSSSLSVRPSHLEHAGRRFVSQPEIPTRPIAPNASSNRHASVEIVPSVAQRHRSQISSGITLKSSRDVKNAGTRAASHEIWHPSKQTPSNYSGLPPSTPRPSEGVSGLPVTEDDWRAYPAFPSAYPATPAPRLSTLKPSNALAKDSGFTEPGGGKSGDHESRPLNPHHSSVTDGPNGNGVGLSKFSEVKIPRQSKTRAEGRLAIKTSAPYEDKEGEAEDEGSSEEDEDDAQEDEDEEEDIFDVTLQTPKAGSVLAARTPTSPLLRRPSTGSPVSSDTDSSNRTQSTSLETNRNGSSLRTQSDSDSSTSDSESSASEDPSNAAGRVERANRSSGSSATLVAAPVTQIRNSQPTTTLKIKPVFPKKIAPPSKFPPRTQAPPKSVHPKTSTGMLHLSQQQIFHGLGISGGNTDDEDEPNIGGGVQTPDERPASNLQQRKVAPVPELKTQGLHVKATSQATRPKGSAGPSQVARANSVGANKSRPGGLNQPVRSTARPTTAATARKGKN